MRSNLFERRWGPADPLTQVWTARREVRAASSDATGGFDAGRVCVPPAGARAGTSQRDVPTAGWGRNCLTAVLLTLASSVPVNRAAADGLVPEGSVPAGVSVETLLRESDRSRGGDAPGMVFESVVTAWKGGKPGKNYSLRIEADRNNSLVTFLKPEYSKGTKLLVQGRNMWFLSSDVKRPVPISPRQRLLGEASNGDIATINYTRDYAGTLTGQCEVNGKSCYVLELKARGNDVSYDRIIYYVSKEDKLGLKADYFTGSGKHFKTASLEYENRLEDHGRSIPFVSRMEIQDEVTKGEKTILTYANPESRAIAPTRFDKSTLLTE